MALTAVPAEIGIINPRGMIEQSTEGFLWNAVGIHNEELLQHSLNRGVASGGHDAVVKIVLLDSSLSLYPRLGHSWSFNSSCPRGKLHASRSIWAMGRIQVACDYVPAFRLPGMSSPGKWSHVQHRLWSSLNYACIRN